MLVSSYPTFKKERRKLWRRRMIQTRKELICQRFTKRINKWYKSTYQLYFCIRVFLKPYDYHQLVVVVGGGWGFPIILNF
jgi:hypothetical protein